MANNNWLFVGAAYAVTWTGLIGYLVHLIKTTKRARAMLDAATKGSFR
jgi:CcmD family protein